MADGARGALLAIDGTRGEDVAEAARLVARALAKRQLPSGVSRWDASGLFGDVVAAPVQERDISPRTLVLLYAADLAFRLRWEIGPALSRGTIVIAAPYIETVVAFGQATGLSSDWLRTLFRFAPAAKRTAILRERARKQRWKRQADRGFAECCTTLLEATPEGFARRKTREAMVDALSSVADRSGGVHRDGDLRALAVAIATPLRRPRRSREPSPETVTAE